MNRRPERIDGRTAERLFSEAVAAHRAGDFALAARRLEKLRAAFPDHPDVLHLLGHVRLGQGRPLDAIDPLRRAVRAAEKTGRKDLLVSVLNALGSAERRAGEPAKAAQTLERAAQLAPNDADIYFNLGNALKDCGRLADAAAQFARVADLAPRDPAVHFVLGDVRLAVNDFSRARDALEKAVALDPNHVEAHVRLGILRAFVGDADGAVESTMRALRLAPGHAQARSNLILQMIYGARYPAADILAEARRWNDVHAPRSEAPSFLNARDPDRRLKVGYVGGDFRGHPVGWFARGPFAHHDTRAVETFVYMTDVRTDRVTEELHARAGHWRDAAPWDTDRLAAAIRADGIDILVDTVGHFDPRQPLLFARRPAPVQTIGLGLVGTTGLTAMDYIVADRFEIPSGSERFYGEAVVRLADDYVCYAPPEYAPSVASLPAKINGYVTFGSFNNSSKYSPESIALWARVLRAVPDSRILLKTLPLGDPGYRAHFTERFADHGIAADRLFLEGYAPHAEFLAAYGRVDIALDSTPYAGGLTTLESLWMGVPVVTLAGETFAARHSVSHLSNAGLPELIARDADDYVAIAARLAADLDRLADLRASLRSRLAASPVCDGARYTRGLEAAFREMWRRWCAGGSPRAINITFAGEEPRSFDVPPQ